MSHIKAKFEFKNINDEEQYREKFIANSMEMLLEYLNSADSPVYYDEGIVAQDLHHVAYEDFDDRTRVVLEQTTYSPDDIYFLEYDKQYNEFWISNYKLGREKLIKDNS